MKRSTLPFAMMLALLLAPLLAPLLALAQQAYVDIEQRLTPEQLRSVGLTPVQLEQLNRMLREAQAKDPVATSVVEGEAPKPAVATREPGHEPGRGAEAERSSLVGFNDEPIHSRLKGQVSAWEPGTVFELENGQQWKVLKGHMKLRTPLNAPEIVVVPGVAGRWFLQVHEDMPKARVYRID